MRAYPRYLPGIWYPIWKRPIRCDPDIRYLKSWPRPICLGAGRVGGRDRDFEPCTLLYWTLCEHSLLDSYMENRVKNQMHTVEFCIWYCTMLKIIYQTVICGNTVNYFRLSLNVASECAGTCILTDNCLICSLKHSYWDGTLKGQ